MALRSYYQIRSEINEKLHKNCFSYSTNIPHNYKRSTNKSLPIQNNMMTWLTFLEDLARQITARTYNFCYFPITVVYPLVYLPIEKVYHSIYCI